MRFRDQENQLWLQSSGPSMQDAGCFISSGTIGWWFEGRPQPHKSCAGVWLASLWPRPPFSPPAHPRFVFLFDYTLIYIWCFIYEYFKIKSGYENGVQKLIALVHAELRWTASGTRRITAMAPSPPARSSSPPNPSERVTQVSLYSFLSWLL